MTIHIFCQYRLIPAQLGFAASCHRMPRRFNLALLPVALAVMSSKAMVIQPSEITTAGRLPNSKEIQGRVLEVQATDTLFTCYIVSRNSYKDVLALEAWQDLAASANHNLKEGSMVAVTEANLAKVSTNKKKWSHSQCNYFIRYDKALHVKELTTGDFPTSVPVVNLKFASCLREGMVNVIAGVASQQTKEPSGQRIDPLTSFELTQSHKAGKALQVELTAWREHMSESAEIKSEQVYVFRNLAIHRDKRNTFSLNWTKKTKFTLDSETDSKHFFDDVKACTSENLSMSSRSSNPVDYTKVKPRTATLSLLQNLLTPNSARRFPDDEVWECSWLQIQDIVPLKRDSDSLAYLGCAQCNKRECTQHPSAGTKACFAWQVTFADSTTCAQCKCFNVTANRFLTLCLGSPPTELDFDSKKFLSAAKSLRFAAGFIVGHALTHVCVHLALTVSLSVFVVYDLSVQSLSQQQFCKQPYRTWVVVFVACELTLQRRLRQRVRGRSSGTACGQSSATGHDQDFGRLLD